MLLDQDGSQGLPKGTKSDAELDFLTAIERGEVVTQVALKQRIGVSVGLINALLKRSVHKGYVKVRKVPYRRYAYYLTPQGFGEKSRLRSEEHTSELQSLMRISYAVFCLKKK